ncbi:hypothetical protein HBI56_112570 [Parastagonospora nodorum]|uniref:Uncharacterized protein n=1 Tax=Phaeosphaeria nodorum (strain SN15 / ATCC MYA-4574 / FGSC 10173) TaxID=321614 RepID=A0A7U2ETD2_PHANO|nr:hypothetical protein HBH56_045200 [Parastagonospora nodorum]QRC92708.1 hypothetical protein JI435_402880 [Parastagonospora nodorum SN15]KAH3933233.1 hypothetical protein HBH54_072950 [Parastagonospora nodorum]KAH3946366.1 hypothetical protein HBH53_132110 [Parastagonospora nodorum]KAH3973255.1 hypothetical protein HBH52_144990 [Parastagonospora nodorum]
MSDTPLSMLGSYDFELLFWTSSVPSTRLPGRFVLRNAAPVVACFMFGAVAWNRFVPILLSLHFLTSTSFFKTEP